MDLQQVWYFSQPSERRQLNSQPILVIDSRKQKRAHGRYFKKCVDMSTNENLNYRLMPVTVKGEKIN